MESVLAANSEVIDAFGETLRSAPATDEDPLHEVLVESLHLSKLGEIRKIQRIQAAGLPTVISLEQGILVDRDWVEILQKISSGFTSAMKKRTLSCCALKNSAGKITKLFVALSGTHQFPVLYASPVADHFGFPLVFCPAVQNANPNHEHHHNWLFLVARMYKNYCSPHNLSDLTSANENISGLLSNIRECIQDIRALETTSVDGKQIFCEAYAQYKQKVLEKCDASSWHTTCENEMLVLDDANFLVWVALVEHTSFAAALQNLSNSNIHLTPVREKVYRNWYSYFCNSYPSEFSQLQSKCGTLMDVTQQLPLDFLYSKIIKPCAEDNMLTALNADIEVVRQATTLNFVSLFKTRHGRGGAQMSLETVANSVIPLCTGCQAHFYFDLCFALAPPASTTAFHYNCLIEGSGPAGLPATICQRIKEDVEIRKS